MIDQDVLKERLEELALELRTGYKRPSFTKGIKKVFGSLFSDPKTFRYANGMKDCIGDEIDGETEFVYDFVAVEETESARGVNFITNTILALETELDESLDCVINDFQKLLLSNAEYKVMVFKCHSSEFEEYTSYMEENIRKYKRANGEFYLISRLNDKLTFEIKIITA